MSRKATNFLLILILSLIFGCASVSSKYTTQAAKLETAGIIEGAADQYYLALQADRTNADAMIGLKRTAQKVLDAKLRNVEGAGRQKNNQLIVAEYTDASRYFNKIKNVGVKLKWSATADKINKEAEDVINRERVANSYQLGVSALTGRNYRKAYNYFSEVIRNDPDYKDVSNLRSRALKAGKVKVGIFPFKNTTRSFGVEDAVQATMLGGLMQANDPFLEFIDREYLSQLLAEQNLGMSGIIDEYSAAEAGKIIGLKNVVFGKIFEVTEDKGEPLRDQLRAYEVKSKQVEETYKVGNETRKRYVTKYYGIPVTVNTYTNSNSVRISGQIQIISTETAQILRTEIITSTKSDAVKYAECGGCNYNRLSRENPGDQTTLGGFLTDIMTLFSSPVDKSLFKASKHLTSTTQLKSSAQRDLGDKISAVLLRYYRN